MAMAFAHVLVTENELYDDVLMRIETKNYSIETAIVTANGNYCCAKNQNWNCFVKNR
jgi:hypothetical protein